MNTLVSTDDHGCFRIGNNHQTQQSLNTESRGVTIPISNSKERVFQTFSIFVGQLGLVDWLVDCSWIGWLYVRFGWLVFDWLVGYTLDWLIGQVLISSRGWSAGVAGVLTFANFSDHSWPNFTTSYHPSDHPCHHNHHHNPHHHHYKMALYSGPELLVSFAIGMMVQNSSNRSGMTWYCTHRKTSFGIHVGSPDNILIKIVSSKI